MILDKEVEITIGSHSFKHYKKMDYPVEHNGQKLIVKIEHIIPGSHVKINVQCDICEFKKKIKYEHYFKNTKNLIQTYCCSHKCATEKRKETNLKLYGVENIHQNGHVK